MLRACGFRYSGTRDAYVLRIVGRRLGPVFQERLERPPLDDDVAGAQTADDAAAADTRSADPGKPDLVEGRDGGPPR